MKLYGIILLFFIVSCQLDQQNTVQWHVPEQLGKEKIIIQASNELYVVLGERDILIANQQDSSKAEVFEKIKTGAKTYLLRASNGKFVCVDKTENNYLFANRDYGGEWETFEIIMLNKMKMLTKTNAGKYVGFDSLNSTLTEKADIAGEQEVFNFIEK